MFVLLVTPACVATQPIETIELYYGKVGETDPEKQLHYTLTVGPGNFYVVRTQSGNTLKQTFRFTRNFRPLGLEAESTDPQERMKFHCEFEFTKISCASEFDGKNTSDSLNVGKPFVFMTEGADIIWPLTGLIAQANKSIGTMYIVQLVGLDDSTGKLKPAGEEIVRYDGLQTCDSPIGKIDCHLYQDRSMTVVVANSGLILRITDPKGGLDFELKRIKDDSHRLLAPSTR